MPQNKFEIYQDSNGTNEIKVQFDGETVWLNQRQMAQLFEKDSDTIGLHLKNIFKTKELDKNLTNEKFSVVQKEGTRHVRRKILFYNLDAIISVGYRVNSKRGTQFRIWASRILKEHLINGYTLNQKRLAQKEQEVEVLKDGIRILGRAIEKKTENDTWLTLFSKGLGILDDYDHERLDLTGTHVQQAVFPALAEYQSLISQMKIEFDSEVFGKEKDQSFLSAIAQIEKGFSTTDFYPSLEEKATMLLYLIVKNHAFVDGNKRIAAACFLLFLQRNQILFGSNGNPIINNDALASITLFIASSKPEEMETVKRLVISVLNRNQHKEG